MPLAWDYHGDRVTPFSRIDLDHHKFQASFEESLSTMEVELEQAVLVIRGTHQGRTVEFQVGSLVTQGPRNGMVLIQRAEIHEFNDPRMIRRYVGQEEYRILLDCELQPDKNGHAYTIRMDEEQK